MKYSVIIPVYNAETTIVRCVDSLLSQPHAGAQILLINDGSTDKSGEICRHYAENHDCVLYFEKENGGVSSARNLGLEKAAGEYILFVDSDDYVTADYFAVIEEATERWKPDMLIYSLKCFGTRNDVWTTGSFFSEDSLEIAEYVRRASRAYLYSNLMGRSFRREIVSGKHLRFDEELLIGEDQAFIFGYTMHVRRMAAIDHVLYNYSTENSNSLSQRTRAYLTEQLLRGNRQMQNFLEDSDASKPVRRIYRETVSWAHYRSAYSACKELRKFDYSAEQRREKIRQICVSYKKAGIRPAGFGTWLIALPVLGKMALVLDVLPAVRSYFRRLLP